MIDLNIRALTGVTYLTLPYMPQGGRIINISSIASFVPNATRYLRVARPRRT